MQTVIRETREREGEQVTLGEYLEDHRAHDLAGRGFDHQIHLLLRDLRGIGDPARAGEERGCASTVTRVHESHLCKAFVLRRGADARPDHAAAEQADPLGGAGHTVICGEDRVGASPAFLRTPSRS